MREIALATLDKRPNESFHAVFCFVADCASLVWPDLKVELPKAAPIDYAIDDAVDQNVTDAIASLAGAPEPEDPGQPGPGVEAEADSSAAVQQAHEEFEADALQAGEVSASPATRLPAPARPGWQKVGTGPTILTAKPSAAPVTPKPAEPEADIGIGWTPALEEEMRRLRMDEGLPWKDVAERVGRAVGACQMRATNMKGRNKWFRKVTDQVLTSGGGGSSLGQVI